MNSFALHPSTLLLSSKLSLFYHHWSAFAEQGHIPPFPSYHLCLKPQRVSTLPPECGLIRYPEKAQHCTITMWWRSQHASQKAPEGWRKLFVIVKVTILGLLHTLPYLIHTTHEMLAVIVPLSQVKRLEGYIACPRLHIANGRTGNETQFSLIVKSVLIPLWDCASLRQRWMVVHVVSHLTSQTAQGAWSKLCGGLRNCFQCLHQHKYTEREREKLALPSLGTPWSSVLEHLVFLSYKQNKMTLANLWTKLIFINDTR